MPLYVARRLDAQSKRETLVPSVDISPSDVNAAFWQLPSEGVQWLLSLGARQAEIDTALQRLGNLDSAAVAGVYPGAMRINPLTFAAYLTAPGPLMCYRAGLAAGSTFSAAPMSVVDRFDGASLNLKSPSVVCNIAGVDNVDDQLLSPFDEARHLVGLAVKRTSGSGRSLGVGTTHMIANAVQSNVHVTLRKESHVLLASSASLGNQGTIAPGGVGLDDFKCFKVTSPDAPKYITGDGIFGDVRDQVAEQALVVGKPRYLCVPVAIGSSSESPTRIGALTCYSAKRCTTCAKDSSSVAKISQSVANGVMGSAVMRLRGTAELCIPSVLDPPVVP
jgi:hypothetical protein